ncbi:MAG: hypothetical protein ACW99Q_22135 [Candidatus Kariarchaeaceae archaeon]
MAASVKSGGALYLAPFFRFLVELTTWVWFLILGLRTFDINILSSDVESRISIAPWTYLILLLISLIALSQLNFPGDKRNHGILVPGWTRIGVEIGSGLLGIFGAWALFGLFVGVLQTFLTLIAFFFDRERWKWFLGHRQEPPEYVKAIHRTS